MGDVKPLRTNPRTAEFSESIQPVSDLFNAVYRSLYLVMIRMFDSEGNQSRAVGALYLLMADVLAQLGTFLVNQQIRNGEFASPTFEIFEFETDRPLDEVIELAAASAEQHPELSTVHEALRALGFIF